MSFDPMAAVVDWLDAYRSGDVETMLKLYAGDATVECGCGGTKTMTGVRALRAYLEQRFRESPASELDDLQPARDGAAITYVSKGRRVRSDFEFDGAGLIAFQRCGPMACN